MSGFFDLSAGAKILLALSAVVVLAEGLYINHVMGGDVTKVLSSETTCERVIDKWNAEHPEESKDRELYKGPIAPIDYETSPIKQAKEFKSAINEAVAKGPNFAGKYAVAQWGCGTACQGHAIINVQTGKIITFGPQSQAGVGVSPESNVLIVNPKENFPPIAEMQEANLETLVSLTNIPSEYYVLDGATDETAALRKICTENPFEGLGI